MRSLTVSQCRDLRTGVICVDLGALTTASSKRVLILNLLEPVNLTVWKVMIERKLQLSSLEWTMGVAMVLAVLRSRYGRIQRSSYLTLSDDFVFCLLFVFFFLQKVCVAGVKLMKQQKIRSYASSVLLQEGAV